MTTNHKPQHTCEILQSSNLHTKLIDSNLHKKTNDECFTFLKGLLQQKTCLSFVVGWSLNLSMQVPTNLPPLKLARLLFLLTLIQANDHSRENSHMKRNSCMFYFKILLKSTHTQWASNHNKKLSSPHPLFSSFSSLQPHISYKPKKSSSYPHHLGF